MTDNLTVIHNRDAGKILRAIVTPTITAGGGYAGVMTLLESVVVGVLLVVAPKGREEALLDCMVAQVKERIAKDRLKQQLATAEPEGHG